MTAMFTQDWSAQRNYWPDMFADLNLVGKPDLRFLEIGCYEGKTTLWLLENVLTDQSSTITVVDTFEGSMEFEQLGIEGNSFQRFLTNTADYAEQVVVRTGRSDEILRTLHGVYDFVYIDGSHLAADVLSDAVLAWPLLAQGGMMVFDDYEWQIDLPEWAKPQLGIDAFASAYQNQLAVRFSDVQFVVEKL